MTTTISETERKYDAPSDARLPDLLDVPRIATQHDADELRLKATYYDTPSLDLARAGITLRHRTGGHDAGWHLKIPADDSWTRTELQLPSAPEVPEEFIDLLTARLRGEAVRPVATITTRRRTSTLADEGGERLAEVALDAVTAEVLGGEAVMTRWTEVEVELSEGVERGGKLLKAVDRTLRHSGLHRSVHRTKLEAAFEAAGREVQSPASADKHSSAGDVVLAYLRAQREELLSSDVRVRRAEPDSIHQMRVAARRMRAALREFRDLFDRAQGEHLISELRWLGQELGAARDTEVLRDLLLDQLADVPVTSVLGPVRARIVGSFATRQAEAERHVADVLGSGRYIELLDGLEAFLDSPPLTGEAVQRAADALPRSVRHARRRIERRMRTARRSSAEARDAALHDVRKAAKRARYAAEVTSLATGKRAGKAAKALKKVQSVLGDQHDSVIAAAELRALAIRAHGEGESAYTYGLLNGRLTERARHLAARADKRWRRADSRVRAKMRTK